MMEQVCDVVLFMLSAGDDGGASKAGLLVHDCVQIRAAYSL